MSVDYQKTLTIVVGAVNYLNKNYAKYYTKFTRIY